MLDDGLARGLMTAPRAERLDEARRGRRINRVESDDLVGEQAVAGAGRVVKVQLVGLRERADQRAHPVRVLAVEGRVAGQFANPLGGLRQ